MADREIHLSHRPERDGEELYRGGKSCKLCLRFVQWGNLEVTDVGVRPCSPPAAETLLRTAALRRSATEDHELLDRLKDA